MISRAREFGYEYFDGDRMYGYGGCFYKKSIGTRQLSILLIITALKAE